jgi:hypothetical protein
MGMNPIEERIIELTKEGNSDEILKLFYKRWINSDLHKIATMCEDAKTLVDMSGYIHVTLEWLSSIKRLSESTQLDFLKLIENKSA